MRALAGADRAIDRFAHARAAFSLLAFNSADSCGILIHTE
jgi:hypothetical protein